MSFIVHRCAVCEHPDIFHGTSGDCCYSQCASGRHNPQYRDPEVIPTWAQATGALVEEIAVPGSNHAGFGQRAQPLCGCDKCVALHAELTA